MARTSRVAAAALATLALVATGCRSPQDSTSKSDSSSTSTLAPGTVTTTAPEEVRSTLLTSTDGYLLAADPQDATNYQFISVTAPTDPGDPASPSADVAVHDQLCFVVGADGADGRFVMPVGSEASGTESAWGVFRLTGDRIGSFVVTQITTFGADSFPVGPPDVPPRPYGCASLSDGRIVTTDLGWGGADGQVTVWFGPFDGAKPPTACRLDTALVEPRGVWVDEQDRVLIASSGDTAGVWRYSRLPTSADAVGGCSGPDAAGAPTADRARKESFIAAGPNGLTDPSGITGSVDHGILVSSAISGQINEYDANGEFRTAILSAGPTERLDDANTFFAGTPLGMAIDVDGTLYYADPGWTLDRAGRTTSAPGTGIVQALALDGLSSRPDVFLDALTEPTNVTIFAPRGGREGSPL